MAITLTVQGISAVGDIIVLTLVRSDTQGQLTLSVSNQTTSRQLTALLQNEAKQINDIQNLTSSFQTFVGQVF